MLLTDEIRGWTRSRRLGPSRPWRDELEESLVRSKSRYLEQRNSAQRGARSMPRAAKGELERA
jgi:hypothetical protein